MGTAVEILFQMALPWVFYAPYIIFHHVFYS